MAKTQNKGSVDNLVLNVPMWPLAIVTVSLPGFSLAFCFITAFIFRFEDVNETMCEVKNYIPSVSAVTGITPQTYFWQTCVALHTTPRFAVNFMYYRYYLNRLHLIPSHRVRMFKVLTKLNFCLNFIENCCLLMVTIITNRENYPLHEKIFVVFMVTSLCYMLVNTILFKWTREQVMSETEKRSYWWKKVMFVSIASATIGLIIFFIQHRLFCVVGAFSMFSLCEYVIAYTNMGYHFTGYLDFSDHHFLIGCLHAHSDSHSSNGTSAVMPNNNNRLKNKIH